MYKSLPPLNAPNEELQLDYAGPLSDGAENQVYILLAIDRFSKYPFAILTKTNGANKILKFLKIIFLLIVFLKRSGRTNILVLKNKFRIAN